MELIKDGPFAGYPRHYFQCFYVDPPWHFHVWSGRGELKSASRKYQTMRLPEIMALPVAELAAPNAVMFLWIIQPLLPRALDVLAAWGFDYKTVGFYWVKIKGGQDRLFYWGEDVKMGLGYHTRAGAEQCWIAVKGNGYDREKMGVEQVCFGPIREHSRKPGEIRDRIAELVGDVPKIELFARTRRPGWEAWGNEVSKFGEAA
jgi:N6-adenosine-specific RNA methylase IME4